MSDMTAMTAKKGNFELNVSGFYHLFPSCSLQSFAVTTKSNPTLSRYLIALLSHSLLWLNPTKFQPFGFILHWVCNLFPSERSPLPWKYPLSAHPSTYNPPSPPHPHMPPPHPRIPTYPFLNTPFPFLILYVWPHLLSIIKLLKCTLHVASFHFLVPIMSTVNGIHDGWWILRTKCQHVRGGGGALTVTSSS